MGYVAPDMTTPAAVYRIARLGAGDDATATALFETMAAVFEEEDRPLGAAYLARLLVREETWILVATLGDAVIGGLTAHTLPMTRSETREIFIYDIAVRAEHQRRGVGRLLMSQLTRLAGDAGIHDLFVPADNEDTHALDFYRALGGAPLPVTFFTFSPR